MSDTTIPDAAVEAAARAAYEYGFLRHVRRSSLGLAWDDISEEARESWRQVVLAAAPHIAAQVLRDALARLGRAAYAVDSTHHFHGIQCSCGFTGDARKRTQTEHITTAVLEAYDHD